MAEAGGKLPLLGHSPLARTDLSRPDACRLGAAVDFADFVPLSSDPRHDTGTPDCVAQSSLVMISLITNFWTFPVTVIGYSSTNRT
jgi:hypothetical protein